jgi:hypothetical protein
LLKFVGKIYKKPGKNIERFVIYLKNQIKRFEGFAVSYTRGYGY